MDTQRSLERQLAKQPSRELSSATGRISSGYVPTLDGWRMVAIIWVMLGHNQPWKIGWLSSSFIHGGRGVQLFFALSGWLICNRLLREEQRFGGISLRSFYTRRFFRIQPAALTYLTLISILMLWGKIPQAWSTIVGSVLMIRSFVPRTQVNWETAHFWSLAVEEQFYLFMPGFLILCRRYRLAAVLALTVGFEAWRVAVMQTHRLQGFSPLVFIRTDVVIGGIFLGSAFALALRYQRWKALGTSYLYPWVSFLYTAAVFARIGFHHSRSDHVLEISVFPLLIVATILHPQSLTGRFLELAPVRFVGRISYSLYLWQELFFNPLVVPAPGSFRSHRLACWVAAFGCAIASYYLIERPLIRYGHRVARKYDLEEMGKRRGGEPGELAEA